MSELKLINSLRDNQTGGYVILNRRKPTITLEGAKRIASSNLEWYEILTELIDNPILSDNRRCVDVGVYIHRSKLNPENSYIEVRDNSIGIPTSDMLAAFDYGTSVNVGKMLLSKMGMGLKGAVNYLGVLDYIVSKVNGCQKSQLVINPDSFNGGKLEYLEVEPTTTDLDAENHGTVVKVSEINDVVPEIKRKDSWKAFYSKIENTYADLISKNRVKITLTYTDDDKTRYMHECEGSHPLMSNPRHTLNSNTNLGHNEPTYKAYTDECISDLIVKTKNTKFKLTAWHKPTSKQVEHEWQKSKKEVYNPDRYKNSLFTHGSANSGITIKYKDKYVMFNIKPKSSRMESQGVIIEIDDDSGLSFTAYKSTLKRDNAYKEMISEVEGLLQKWEFYERSKSNTPQVSEKEIIQKFLDFVKEDEFYSRDLGIVDFEKQIITQDYNGVGVSDITIRDYNDSTKVTCVIEAKKDRTDGSSAGQLWRYMAHYSCKRGFVLSNEPETSTFKEQVRDLIKFTEMSDIDIQSVSIKSLKASKFFK